MERRAFLKNLTKIAPVEGEKPIMEEEPTNTGLNKFTGTWDKRKIAHLLRRATYGFKFSDLETLEKEGLDKTIELLFRNLPLTDLPLNYDYADDPNVPLGQTWVNEKKGIDNNTSNYQFRSIRAWRVGRTYSGELSIKEKMTTFWINHFGIADVDDGRFLWRYLNLLYDNFDGDFKKIIEEITINPSMLRFLDGRVNTRRSPNENFAREVLELFTIGKGPTAGPGDYTNYTEKDIFELAKVFTGWRDTNYRNAVNEGIEPVFTLGNHDTTTKQLSERFGNAKIASNGINEYKDAINVIFQQPEVSKFIARKLYRYFVYYKIDNSVEQNIIEPLAKMIRDDKYVLKRAIKTLLSSEHFYDAAIIGTMIKNPQDFMSHASVNLGLTIPGNYVAKYRYLYSSDLLHGRLEMSTFNLPSVAGWKAYYQEPTYYQGWINSVTLPLRTRITDTFHLRTVYSFGGLGVKIDGTVLLNSFKNPSDINEVLSNLNVLLFAKPFTDKQITSLKKLLSPKTGTDGEWSTTIKDWNANPSTSNTTNVRMLMHDLLRTMSYMPEYQLS
jgi:uncharacterized protein (DUF1800 family)